MRTGPRIEWVANFAAAGAMPAHGALVGIGRLDEAVVQGMSPTAADAADAHRHPIAHRPRFFTRRALLRRFVAQRMGWPADGVIVAYDAHGQPRIRSPGRDLFVSSASRQDWLALALGCSPIGVDLELLDAPAEPAWNILHASERARLQQLPSDQRWDAFVAIWTAKEAYLKAIGLGLSREPCDIEVRRRAGASAFALRDRDEPVVMAAAGSRTLEVGLARVHVACALLPAGVPSGASGPSRREA